MGNPQVPQTGVHQVDLRNGLGVGRDNVRSCLQIQSLADSYGISYNAGDMPGNGNTSTLVALRALAWPLDDPRLPRACTLLAAVAAWRTFSRIDYF